MVNKALRDAVAGAGLFYPPDPSSYDWCTIGGNLATNSGGLCCVKYGVTTDYVLGLEVVLADGRVLRTGRRTVKGVAGYDLTRLFVGSEGTLGVITEATLALRPAPQRPVTLAATFATTAQTGQVVERVVTSGLVPSLLEVMDNTCICAVDDLLKADLDRDAHALLVAQSDSRRRGRGRARSPRWPSSAGGRGGLRAHHRRPGRGRPAARRPAHGAAGAGAAGQHAASTTSPCRGRGSRRSSTAATPSPPSAALVIGVVGHAGDGNMHPTICSTPPTPTSASGPSPRSTTSSSSGSPSAARSPASTGSAPSRSTGWSARSGRCRCRCTGRSRTRWTRPACSTRARSSARAPSATWPRSAGSPEADRAGPVGVLVAERRAARPPRAGNPAHRCRVEHDDAILLVHLSGEDGQGWTALAVDRATRRWAVGQARTQLAAATRAVAAARPGAAGPDVTPWRREQDRLVVIGGDAAGMSAAAQARRLREAGDLEIVVLEQGPDVSYSACGIPYWVGGQVEDRDKLIARTPAQFADQDIEVRPVPAPRRSTSTPARSRPAAARRSATTTSSSPPAAGRCGRPSRAGRRRRARGPPAGRRRRHPRGHRGRGEAGRRPRGGLHRAGDGRRAARPAA